MKRAVLGTAVVVLATALIGSLLSWTIAHYWIGQPVPGRGNAYFYLFGRYELPHLLLLAGSTVAAALYCLTPRPSSDVAEAGDWRPPALVVVIAFTVVAVARIGSHFVLHDFPLSMDEFNAVFQSRIFANGRLAAPVPPEWRDLIPAINPIFVTYRAEDHTWLSGYLPVYAGIRAMFLKLGLDSLVNPVLSGLSVLALAGVARRLWPEDRRRWALAILILVTSSQFLVTAMSWYSMPAHLLLNSCWLLLYLRGARAALVAPWVGVLALGLHNPFPHALFVAPFLARMLRMGQWRSLSYALTIYALGSAGWLVWWDYALPPGGPGGGAALFGLPGSVQLATQMMNLSMALSWQVPLFGLGLGVAVSQWRTLPPVERDLAGGVLLTLAFYFFFLYPQGHGWGYRYLHPVLSSAALLAARGTDAIGSVVGSLRFRRLAVASVLLALTVQLPLRLCQVEQFVRPWAVASAAIEAMPAGLVILPTTRVWYGFDLVRNDPFFRSPVIVSEALARQSRRGLGALEQLLGLGTRVVSAEELARFGLRTVPNAPRVEN